MFTSVDLRAKASRVLDLIANQSFNHLSVKLNVAGAAFDPTHGLGQAAATSTAVLLHLGGFDDQRCVATLKYPAPTTTGTEDLGVMLRCLTLDGSSTYYYARVSAGSARLVKVVAGTFTTLTSVAWSVAQGVNITIDASVVGSLVSATFTAAAGPAPVTLTATDTAIPGGGVMGFRSLSKAVWCSAIAGYQL